MLTGRGTKSGNIIIVEWCRLVVCPMSLYDELHKLSPTLKTHILLYTRLYIEIVEATILFGQRLWAINWLVEKLKARPQYTQAITV